MDLPALVHRLDITESAAGLRYTFISLVAVRADLFQQPSQELTSMQSKDLGEAQTLT
jgi:hypothetical protein